MSKQLSALPKRILDLKIPPRANLCLYIRTFVNTGRRFTDGFYGELTEMRTKKPYIVAIQEQEETLSLKSKSISTDKRDLSPKPMSASYHAVIIPLARDPWLLDSYITSFGTIRLGRLFMDLDALAGVVSYKHTGDSVMTVTAAVDRITITRPFRKICDLELSGRVTFATGRSSLEVGCVVKSVADGSKDGDEEVLMECAFTMVSLDPVTKKPVPISPLKTETPEEKGLFERGERNYHLKKHMANTALKKQSPNEEEANLIHSLWRRQLEYRDPQVHLSQPPTTIPMSSTRIQSVQIMQPQYRNRHSFMIFGGYLLKSTFELAYTCISSISPRHSRPSFIALDPSTFENPVPVGSTLYLTAVIAYTDSPLVEADGKKDVKLSAEGKTWVQVRVDSKVKDMDSGEVKETGQFNYLFECKGDIEVFPETYSEFMVYLDARRRKPAAYR